MTEPQNEAATLINYWGGVAYDAYFRHCQGKSINGQTLPSWDNQDPAIRAHWYAAAKAVRDVAVEEYVASASLLILVLLSPVLADAVRAHALAVLEAGA